MGEAADTIRARLESVPFITEANARQRAQVSDLLNHPGLDVLLGLLLAEKQGMLVSLQNAHAATPEHLQRLGVVQGRTIGIDRIREVLLECVTVPTEAKD